MKTLVLILFLASSQFIQPLLSPDCYTNENISNELKASIIEVVSVTINRYKESGNFWNEDFGQFDNDKYLEFVKLFSGNAEVVDDLSFNEEILPYHRYAEKIFDNLQELGVPFDLEDIIINRIDIDEGGYYVVDLNASKRLFSGLNQNGNPVKLKKGRKIKLNMRIDLPDYLLTDARIQYIKMQTPKKVTEYIKQPITFIAKKLKRN